MSTISNENELYRKIDDAALAIHEYLKTLTQNQNENTERKCFMTYIYEFVSPDGVTIGFYSNPESAIQAFKERRKLSPNYYPTIPTEYRWYKDKLQVKNYDTFEEWENWCDYNFRTNKDNWFSVYKVKVED